MFRRRLVQVARLGRVELIGGGGVKPAVFT